MDALAVDRAGRDRLRRSRAAPRSRRSASGPPPRATGSSWGANLGLGLQIPIGEHAAFVVEARGFYFPTRSVEWEPVLDRPLTPIEKPLLQRLQERLPRRVRALVGASHLRLRGPILTFHGYRPRSHDAPQNPRPPARHVHCAGAAAPGHARQGPRHVPPPLPPPAGGDAPGLPPLPERSPRNASYTIEARLDPGSARSRASLVLDWRNTSDQALASFPFHLYWNAFRNNLSTTARGEGRRAPAERSWTTAASAGPRSRACGGWARPTKT